MIIFALILWSLSAGYFPRYFPEYSVGLYWLSGLIATILFFASIVVHELAHSLTAVRLGIQIPEITLFLFGGVAHLSEEPADPKTELKIAIAGPLASFALAVAFWLIKIAIKPVAPGLVVAIFDYLAWINLALGIFNLIPGYPLDGGRILRAIVWWRTGSVAWATKWASNVGKGFAWALMFLGVFQLFTGALIGGLWMILIGMFLRGLAATGYEDTMVKESLEGIHVKDIMLDDAVAVPPDLTVSEAADKYFMKYGYGGFPVVRDKEPLGILCLTNVKDVPVEERTTTTVEQAMIPMSDGISVVPDESVLEALKKMTQADTGRLLVLQNGAMLGMVTRTGLFRFLEIKRVLTH